MVIKGIPFAVNLQPLALGKCAVPVIIPPAFIRFFPGSGGLFLLLLFLFFLGFLLLGVLALCVV